MREKSPPAGPIDSGSPRPRGSKGGLARAAKLSGEQRSLIAGKAAKARWGAAKAPPDRNTGMANGGIDAKASQAPKGEWRPTGQMRVTLRRALRDALDTGRDGFPLVTTAQIDHILGALLPLMAEHCRERNRGRTGTEDKAMIGNGKQYDVSRTILARLKGALIATEGRLPIVTAEIDALRSQIFDIEKEMTRHEARTAATPERLRVVVFKEMDAWLAQGLERDICVHAASVEELSARFKVAVKLERNAAGTLDHLTVAPKRFFDMWDMCAWTLRPLLEQEPRIDYRLTQLP